MTINETITSMSLKRSGNLNIRESGSTVDMKHFIHFSRQLKGVFSKQLQKECDECYGASASETGIADGKESEQGDSKQSERSRSKGGSEPRQFQGSKLGMARMYYKLYAYFNGASGSMEVWENALQLLSSTQSSPSSYRDTSNYAKSSSVSASSSSSSSVSPVASINKFLLRDPASRAVVSEQQVLIEAKTVESKLLASAAAGRRGAHEMSAKVEGQLRQAALLCAKSGQMAKYCGIMVELGDWNAALALAPAVSMEYWQELVAQNSQRLISQSSEQCVPHLLAAGADADAVEFYLQRRSPGDAMLVAKYSEVSSRQHLMPFLLLMALIPLLQSCFLFSIFYFLKPDSHRPSAELGSDVRTPFLRRRRQDATGVESVFCFCVVLLSDDLWSRLQRKRQKQIYCSLFVIIFQRVSGTHRGGSAADPLYAARGC